MTVVLVALGSQVLLTDSDTWEVPPTGAWPLHECSAEEESLTGSNVNIIERFKLGRLGFVRTVVLMLQEVQADPETPPSPGLIPERAQRRDWDCAPVLRRHLDYSIVGSHKVPAEISLPRVIQRAEPPNLFQPLAEDPAAHTRATSEFQHLQHRLVRLLRALTETFTRGAVLEHCPGGNWCLLVFNLQQSCNEGIS
ncbi:hypothetical protein DUI87_12612 [Hirundo rustica rustica]|uniref:Uncharacterized protein n=1 Tax=Hirundo rustica rustica TaxID=333673 RepID=A0A3M0KCG2_HIRRU|nr:hypothetical protein DUI87_12612 [Hirundo rustica rustica]